MNRHRIMNPCVSARFGRSCSAPSQPWLASSGSLAILEFVQYLAMRVSAAFLSFSWVAVAGCTPEADYPSDVIVESEHFVYQARAGAPFCPASVAAIEDHFAAS